MNPERWQQIERLYQAALERAADERASFLAQACAGDDRLRQEVESLVESHESQDSFLQTAAFALGMELLANEESASLAGEEIGQVYLARDTRLGRKVAIKLLPASVTQNAERVQRFELEARAASTISHPNIAHIYEVGEAEGRQFIAMGFIGGVTLRQRPSQCRIELREALEITTQIAAALSAAHAAGVLHRDIKPDNVLLGRDGVVKVLDFGLAKLTERQAVELEQNSAKYHAALAWNLFNQEKYADAESSYRAAVQLEPMNAGYHFGQGQTLEFQAKFPEAIIAYRKSVELEPANSFYISGVAYVSANLEEFAESEVYYRKSLQYEPSNISYLTGLGWVLEQQGKCAEAEQQTLEAIRFSPAYPPYAAPQKLLKRIRDARCQRVRSGSGNPWRI